ncbi:MAG: hypothetical protein ABMA13_16110 [Chthoniobacteraceae bacterium]
MSCRSIVARFSPLGFQFPAQYLRRDTALFAENEWSWSDDRAEAFVFDTHLDADAASRGHRYQDAQGDWHFPWALVLGNPALDAEREHRHRDRLAGMEASVAPAPVNGRVTPVECAERTRRLLGERD